MFTNGVLQRKQEGGRQQFLIRHYRRQPYISGASELLKIIINMQRRDVSRYSLNWGILWYMHWIYQGLSSPPYPTEESSRAHVFFPPHTLTAPSIISCQYTQTLFNLGSQHSCRTRGGYCYFTSEKIKAGEDCASLGFALRKCPSPSSCPATMP